MAYQNMKELNKQSNGKRHQQANPKPPKQDREAWAKAYRAECKAAREEAIKVESAKENK